MPTTNKAQRCRECDLVRIEPCASSRCGLLPATQPREQAAIDQNKPDTLAALLCCLYEGPEIQLAATMLIEQAMELEELRATQQAAPEAPIYQIKSFLHQNGWHDTDKQTYDSLKATGQAVRIVYASTSAAPEAPAAATDQPSAGQVDERAIFPAYKPSGKRVMELIEEARQLTDISSTGPIPLTLIQIGYIVGHVAAEAARASLTPTAPQAAEGQHG